MTTTPGRGGSSHIPEDVLDDLSSRFIINVPTEERSDVTRVMFQVELAHWFYLDWLCEERTDLPKLSFKPFCKTLFGHVPFLRVYMGCFDTVLNDFRTYKSIVPTYGTIIVDRSYKYCLMVQGFWAKSSWGFPKGKVNHGEDPKACAIREVREETGFDCTPFIHEHYIERVIRGTTVRLYVVPGVGKDVAFAPLTRGEIRSIEWFKIADLPDAKLDKVTGQNMNTFFMAIPFIKPLREWIKRNNPKRRRTISNAANQENIPITILNSTPIQQPALDFIDLSGFLLQAKERSRIEEIKLAGLEISEAHIGKFEVKKTQAVEKTFVPRWINYKLQADWSQIWAEIEAEFGMPFSD